MKSRSGTRFDRPVSVSLFLLLILAFMYYPSIQRYAYKLVVNEGPAWTSMRPAGEIVSGFTLKQSITVTETDLPEHEFANPICVELQFANYGNRRNTGSFEVRISTNDKVESQTLEASPINDNELEAICFDRFRFEEIYKRDAWLEIRGIDGQPKKSVSVVLSDLPVGARAEVQGTPTSDTLVLYVAIKKDPGMYRVISYVLITLSALIMALLMFATWSLPRKQPDIAG